MTGHRFFKGTNRSVIAFPFSSYQKLIFSSWHQDVKPSNILIESCPGKSPYFSQFKLADLGLSHFKKMSSQVDAMDVDTYGTRAYGGQ